jgi:hypothetical protein
MMPNCTSASLLVSLNPIPGAAREGGIEKSAKQIAGAPRENARLVAKTDEVSSREDVSMTPGGVKATGYGGVVSRKRMSRTSVPTRPE